MNYEIVPTKTFKRDFKPLFKKHHSLLDDLEQFKIKLFQNPEMGDDLGNHTRKISYGYALRATATLVTQLNFFKYGRDLKVFY